MADDSKELIQAVTASESKSLRGVILALNMLDSRIWAFGVMVLGLAAFLLKQSQAGSLLIGSGGVMWQSKDTPPPPKP